MLPNSASIMKNYRKPLFAKYCEIFYSRTMINPIRDSTFFPAKPRKKKAPKEIDVRIRKAAKKSKMVVPEKGESISKASEKLATKQAALTAEKAYAAARQKAIVARQAALKAQKSAFLAQRAHMAQQTAAIKKARAAEKAEKDVKKAKKKASEFRRVIKI
jgi:hypothetical protein